MKRFTLIVVLGLTLAACGGGADETTTTTADDGAATTTTTGGGVTTTAGAAEETTTSLAASGSGTDDSCLEGTWTLDGQSFFDEIMAGMTAEELQGGTFEYVGGAYQVVIGADGTFVDRRVDWHFKVTSPAGELDLIINHERTGEWFAEGGVINVTLPGDVPVEQEILIDGEPFEFPGGALPFSPPAVEWVPSEYMCDSDTLTVTFDEFTSVWIRS